MGRRISPAALLGAAVLAGALAQSPSVAAQDEVNLYSARQEYLIKPLLDRFSEQTGINVNLVTGNADALLQRLRSEGRNSPADVLLTVDAGRLHRAREAGVLQPVESQLLNDVVPAHFRDPDGHWYGLSVRARPIMYSIERVDPQTLSTYEDLAGPQWNDRICIRSSGNIYNQSLVASMIAANGAEETEAWARDFVNNFARDPEGGDRDQIRGVANGECDIAIANTYYLGYMLSDEADPAQQEAARKVAVFWPNQDGRGTHVNVSGAGVTAAAPNRDNAVKLLEFLVNKDSQRWYAERNNEYPVREDVAVSDTLESWGEFKADSLNLSRLGELNREAVMIMDRAGWK